jgi:hypothetical protein
VEQGDYQVHRAEDRRTISRSKIASAVEPEMVLEMSIIIRHTAIEKKAGECPKCHYNNLDVTMTNGWIEWQVPLHFKYADN